MPKPFKRRSEKAGLPPGTLVPVGVEPGAKARITVFDYTEAALEEREIDSIEKCYGYKGKQSVSWINIEGIQDVGAVSSIGEHFGLHPLVLEDVANPSQRPKMEDYGDYLYVVVQMISLDRAESGLLIEQVSLVIGSGYVISFQQIPGDVFDPIRERIRQSKGRIRQMGADYLAYSLLDAIVDNYFGVLERFGDEMEEMADDLIGEPTAEMPKRIYVLKRELLLLRKAVWPLRDLVGGMQRGGNPLIRESTGIYLRDLYDHTVQVMDTIEVMRETTSAMRETYLSSASNRMNEVMKVLTIIATIFIPMTFVAGIYGMNFEFMPELGWPWGYFGALGLMGSMGLVMVLFFRRKGWL